jgi:hypothetical protein
LPKFSDNIGSHIADTNNQRHKSLFVTPGLNDRIRLLRSRLAGAGSRSGCGSVPAAGMASAASGHVIVLSHEDVA